MSHAPLARRRSDMAAVTLQARSCREHASAAVPLSRWHLLKFVFQ